MLLLRIPSSAMKGSENGDLRSLSSKADLGVPFAQEGCAQCRDVFPNSPRLHARTIYELCLSRRTPLCLRASRIVACSAAQEALTLHFAGHDAVTSQAPCECEKLMALYVQQCQNSTQQLQHCVKSCSRGVPQLQSVAGVDVREKQQQTCEDHSAVARLRQVQQPAAGPLCSKAGAKGAGSSFLIEAAW